jgi:hypothetical protein
VASILHFGDRDVCTPKHFLTKPHAQRHSAATQKAASLSVAPTGLKVGNVRQGGGDGTEANFVQVGDADTYDAIKAICTCGVPFSDRVACSHAMAGCIHFKVSLVAVGVCCTMLFPFSSYQ